MQDGHAAAGSRSTLLHRAFCIFESVCVLEGGGGERETMSTIDDADFVD